MSDDKPPSSDSRGRTGWFQRLFRRQADGPASRDDLIQSLRRARQARLFEPDVIAMLEGAIEVAELRVRDIMIPRSHMVVIERDGTTTDILHTIIESGHSRFPVVGDDRDEVAGILLAKDLLRFFAEREGERFAIREVLRPAVFIPESKRLNVLLTEFRASHNHMAIVVDEYGGVSGLITIEDVIEEIVGEIDDEYDEEEEALILRTGENRYQVQALTPIDEFNDEFESEFSDDDYGTIGGLLLAEFGRVPEFNDIVTLGERFEFRVVKADNRRVITLELTVLE